MSNEGGKKLEGVYLSSLVPLLQERLEGTVCRKVGMTSSTTMALCFQQGWLHLNTAPDSPGLWWSRSASVIEPDSPSWEHHLKGAQVESVSQQGADRVLQISFNRRTAYQPGGVILIFEAAGRNANLILTRNSDERILACLRKILSSVNRYRTISPGTVYIKPPASGHPPAMWNSDEVQEKLMNDVTPRLLYRMLEGVGPVTAGAIMAAGPPASRVVKNLARAIESRNFCHWLTPEGPVPVKLGPGRRISDPLAPPEKKEPDSGPREYRPSVKDLEKLLSSALSRETKRIRSTGNSLSRLQSPDDLRLLGNLILTWKKELRKGMGETVLPDWEGKPVRIPLKVSLNPAENAERYFRKAGRIHLERQKMEEKLLKSLDEQERLEEQLKQLKDITDSQAAELLEKLRRPGRKSCGAPLEFTLQGGWRCLAGRNAVQNDRLTFRTAARDDIWLHARGVPGAHVIIRRDGRADNPGKAAIQQAAEIAASRSSSSGVVPVDWTLVKYVRRIKGGGPGQVTYTREKTVFAQT